MRSLFLAVLAVYSSTRFVVAQACISAADCYWPLSGYSSSCYSFLCYTCPHVLYGGVLYAQVFTGTCNPACTPGSAGDALCAFQWGPGFYCLPPTTSTLIENEYGLTTTVDGLCQTCITGSTINADHTACVLYGSTSPPDESPPPVVDSPPPPDNSPPLPPPSPTPTTSPTPSSSTPPVPQAGTSGSSPSTSGSTPASDSSETKKKSGIPAWVKKLLTYGLPGAILTGVVGLVFYFIQNRHKIANERERYPLAGALRTELSLRKVDDFDSRLGLQFRSSVEKISKTLEERAVLKPPQLLGNETVYLAKAIAEALKMRHRLDLRHNERGFLALFANDCSDEQSRIALSFDIEEKVGGNKGWHDKLVLPPNTAAAPTAPHEQAPHPPPAPHDAYWMPPSAPPASH